MLPNPPVGLQSGTLTSADTTATYQWINCDKHTLITGATHRSFTPAVDTSLIKYLAGSFAVIIDPGQPCADTSVCYRVSWEGVNNVCCSKEYIKVYPNPVTNILQVVIPNGITEGRISIQNMLGQEVLAQPIGHTQNVQIDMSQLAAGLYFVQLQNTQQQFVTKVVKQ